MKEITLCYVFLFCFRHCETIVSDKFYNGFSFWPSGTCGLFTYGVCIQSSNIVYEGELTLYL